MRKWLRALSWLSILGTFGCLPAALPFRGGPRTDMITQDQIMSSSYGDLYEMAQTVRPFWIARGGRRHEPEPRPDLRLPRRLAAGRSGDAP